MRSQFAASAAVIRINLTNGNNRNPLNPINPLSKKTINNKKEVPLTGQKSDKSKQIEQI